MKSKFVSAAHALLAAGVLLLAPPAEGTVARYLHLDDQTDESSLVVRATVGTSRTFVAEKDGRPRTDTDLHIVAVYKGDAQVGATIAVRQMRGPQGAATIAVAGDPELRAGEEVVVFLRRAPEGHAYLTSLAQSKFRVEMTSDGLMVQRDLTDLSFLVDSTPQRLVQEIEEAPIPLPLFEQTIREMAADGAR